MGIAVEPEGREGVWVPDREQLVAWLRAREERFPIHCFIGTGILIGADWETESVIEEVEAADRVALLTGDAYAQNLSHALAVISKQEKLFMFDVGSVDEVILIPEAAAQASPTQGGM